MTRVLTPNLANYFFNRKRSSRFSGKIILTQELLTQANHQSVLCLVTHLGPTFWDPWTAAHQALLSMGILQARTLEWIVMSFSSGSSRSRDRTSCLLTSPALAGGFFTTSAIWEDGTQSFRQSKFHLPEGIHKSFGETLRQIC